MISKKYIGFFFCILVFSAPDLFAMQQSPAQKSDELINLIRNHKEAPVHTTLEDMEVDTTRGGLDIFLSDNGPKELRALEARRLSTEQIIPRIRDLITKGAKYSIKDVSGKDAIDYVNELTITNADRSKLLQALGIQSVQPRIVEDTLEKIQEPFGVGPLKRLQSDDRLPENIKTRLKYIFYTSGPNKIDDLKIYSGNLAKAYQLWRQDSSYRKLTDGARKDIEQKFEQVKNYLRDAIIFRMEGSQERPTSPVAQPRVQAAQPSQPVQRQETQEEYYLRKYYEEHPELKRTAEASKKQEELKQKQQAEQERAELIRKIEELRKQKAELERAEQIRKIEKLRGIQEKLSRYEKLTAQEMQFLEEARKALPK
jgi:hypothetical protein